MMNWADNIKEFYRIETAFTDNLVDITNELQGFLNQYDIDELSEVEKGTVLNILLSILSSMIKARYPLFKCERLKYNNEN
jgi:hypothetical protein